MNYNRNVSQKAPHSRPGRLAVVDGRTAEAKYMAQVRAALLRYVGGKATSMQSLLIEQCVVLSLRIHLMDIAFVRTWEMSETDRQDYLACLGMLDRLRVRLTESPSVEEAPLPENFDAELAAAARAAAMPVVSDDAWEIRSKARRLAYGAGAVGTSVE
jgi:hypothetical protein